MNTRFVMIPQMVESPSHALVVSEKKVPAVINETSSALICLPD